MNEGLRVIQVQMRFASIEAMKSVLTEFRDIYSHSMPHMALKGQTPACVWNGQIRAKRDMQRGGEAGKDAAQAASHTSSFSGCVR